MKIPMVRRQKAVGRRQKTEGKGVVGFWLLVVRLKTNNQQLTTIFCFCCLLLSAVCFLPTAYCLLPANAQEPPLAEVAEKLQSKYRQTVTFSADFHQINRYKAVTQKQEASGKVWIKKPGLMRWDYTRPEKNQIISDGKTLWVYTPADKQVIKSKIDQAFGSTPQDFLMGLGDLNQRFHISYANPPKNAQGFLMLNLTSREKEPTISKIMLEVAPPDFEVKRFTLVDLYGNLTTLVFANSQFNQELADSLFNFKVPAGVEVITPPGGKQ